MVVQNLLTNDYQSKEAKMFFLKQRANKVSEFIRGLRRSKSQVYSQIMSGVTGIDALVTLQSLLLQITLYYRKTSSQQILEIFEAYKAHEALAIYYKDKNSTGIVSYLREVRDLFNLVKE